MLKYNNGNPNYSSQRSQSHDYTHYPSDSTFNMDSSYDSLKSFVSEESFSSDDDNNDNNDASPSTVPVTLNASDQKLSSEGESSNSEEHNKKTTHLLNRLPLIVSMKNYH